MDADPASSLIFRSSKTKGIIMIRKLALALALTLGLFITAPAQATEKKNYTYTVVAWRLPGDGQVGTPIWPGQKYYDRTTGTIPVQPEDFTPENARHFFGMLQYQLKGYCRGWQLDIYRYQNEKDRKDVEALISGGVLNGPNNPIREPHVKTDGTTWTFVRHDCPVEPPPTPTPTPTPTPSETPTPTPTPTPSETPTPTPSVTPTDSSTVPPTQAPPQPKQTPKAELRRPKLVQTDQPQELAQTGLDVKWFYILSAILFVIGFGLIAYSNRIGRKR